MVQLEQNSRIRAVNFVFLVTIVISVVVAFLPLNFLVGRPALQLVFSQLILVLPSAVYLLVQKIPYTDAVRFHKMKLADMALCILLGILMQPAMSLINALSMVFATNTTSTFMLELSNQIPFLAAVVLMAVVPCILEESVYRGVFFNEYRKVNPWRAALLSGFLFGLMHGNVNQFCYAAVMGILFAMVIEATGSILSTMLIHFWINAGSVTMIYLYPKIYEIAQAFYRMYQEYGNEEMAAQLELALGDMTLSSTEWMQQLFSASESVTLTVPQVLITYGPMAVIASVLGFFVYRKLAKRNGNWEKICGFFRKKQTKAQPKQRMVTLPLLIGIVVGIAFMIFYEIVLWLSV